MSNAPTISSVVSSISPFIKGASPVVVDLAAYSLARKFFSTRTSYAAATLVGAAALVGLCSSTQKEVLNSGLLYIAYKVILLVLNYRSSPAKSKTATAPHTSTSSLNSSGATSSPPPATEPAPGSSSSNSSGASSSPPPATEPTPGSSSSNSSGAASSPPPATEPAPGPSASASPTPPPSSVPAAAPQSPRRGASQPQSNGDADTPPSSPFNAFPASPSTSPAARPDEPSASSHPAAATAAARPRSLEERKEAALAIKTKFEELGDKFTFTFNGRLNITPASTKLEIQAEMYNQPGFKQPELDVRARFQWSSHTQEFGPLIKAAAKEMITSLSDIELETQHIADPEERRKAVAERLNNDPSFDPLNRTLPFIYFFVRKMRGIIHCPNVDHKFVGARRKIIFSTTLTSSDKETFYQEGTEKNEWRKLYNEAIKAYAPYIPLLKEDHRKWFVQDDGINAF